MATSVAVTLQPLQVVYNPYLTERLLDFGQYMSSVSQSASLAAREASLDSRQLASEMPEAEETRRSLLLDMKLHAPTMLVPDGCSNASASCMRLCMGMLRLTSGEPTPDADVFHVVLSDTEADVCDYQPSTGEASNTRPIFSRTGSSSVRCRKRLPDARAWRSWIYKRPSPSSPQRYRMSC